MTPVKGATGTIVTVTGNNFKALLRLQSSLTLPLWQLSLQTPTGGFSQSITIPPSVAGSHAITASDGTTSSSKNFNVVPNIALTPVKGPEGTSVSVSGTGFAASSPVSVTFGLSGQVSTATTDASGNFVTSFSVPMVPGGTSVVTASDANSNSATANFNVLSKITLTPVKGATGKLVSLVDRALQRFRQLPSLTMEH